MSDNAGGDGADISDGSLDVAAESSAHEFGALNTLLLVVILGLCIVFSYLIKQNSVYYVPDSAAAMFVGMLVGGLARLLFPSKEELEFLSFEPELFFFLLLPPIIFEAGYSLRKKSFFANFWTISLYAVGGTIISTFIIGYLIYYAGVLGLVPIDATSPVEALMFGALISAVDPVATLSIMGNPEIHCDRLLYSLVFGESVLNDAVSIVLFHTFATFYKKYTDFSTATSIEVMLTFSGISIGSLAIGIITGLMCSYLCKYTSIKKYPEYEISILFLFAYGSYSFSEAVGMSGIMSLFFSGIVLSHYNSYNLSTVSQVTAHNIFKSLAVLAEFFVFLYMGMGFFTGKFARWHLGMVILSIAFCFLGRAANIYPFSYLANLFRHEPIPTPMQHVLWFSGLRGAMAFALSLNMPGENRDLYVSTTLSICIFTTAICGGMTEWIIDRMGMKVNSSDAKDTDHDHDMEASGSDGSGHSTSALAPASSDGAPRPTKRSPEVRTFWHRFDAKYMKPYFGGNLDNLDEEDTMLHTGILDLSINGFRPLSNLDLREAFGDFMGIGGGSTHGRGSAPTTDSDLELSTTAKKIIESQSGRLSATESTSPSSSDISANAKAINGASSATSREPRTKRRGGNSSTSGAGTGGSGGYLSDLGERSSSFDSS